MSFPLGNINEATHKVAHQVKVATTLQLGPAQLRILDLSQSSLKIGATSRSHIRDKNERIPKPEVALES